MTGGLHVERLWLQDFRNYASAEVELAAGLTVVVGSNGQGKTNLLEAVAYAATTRSFRGAPADTMVRRDAEAAVVRAAGVRAGRDWLVEAEIRAGGRGRVQLNRQRVHRARDLLEVLLVSVFTPDDLELVKGGPAHRRDYLDGVVVSRQPSLDAITRDLDRILRQKSALLKQARGVLSDDVRTTLDVWNEKLAETGERLASARLDVLDVLAPRVAQAYRDIAGEAAEVAITYESAWRDQGLGSALEARQADEVRRGVCLVGPQRDDLHLVIDGLPARSHASQGEQRTLALALRLGAHRVVGDAAGVHPVLLLDDIFSELDAGRSAALLAHLPPGQAVLTTAGSVPEGARVEARLRVRDGVVVAT